MVVHTIGFCRAGQWNHNGWMNTYIFPGAELPTMSHFTQGFQELRLLNLEDFLRRSGIWRIGRALE